MRPKPPNCAMDVASRTGLRGCSRLGTARSKCARTATRRLPLYLQPEGTWERQSPDWPRPEVRLFGDSFGSVEATIETSMFFKIAVFALAAAPMMFGQTQPLNTRY